MTSGTLLSQFFTCLLFIEILYNFTNSWMQTYILVLVMYPYEDTECQHFDRWLKICKIWDEETTIRFIFPQSPSFKAEYIWYILPNTVSVKYLFICLQLVLTLSSWVPCFYSSVVKTGLQLKPYACRIKNKYLWVTPQPVAC